MIVNDGTGTGNKAKVHSNRLFTSSVIQDISGFSAKAGDSYNINTGDITLTTATISAGLYLKNNEDRNLVIKTLIFLLGNSTGGTGDLVVSVLRNPTVGTIVSGASNVDILSNRNYGSSQILSVDAYKGAEGNTFTDGETSFLSRLAGDSRFYLINTGDLILVKGSSIGIQVTPQASNTSMTIQLALSVYLEEV